MTSLRTFFRRGAVLLCAVLLAACATPRPPAEPGQSAWSGRLALQVDSEPPQNLSAGFDLIGTPDAGELLLTSPLGSVVAAIRWRPGLAEFQQGAQVTRRDSLDALTAEFGDATLPVTALFAWLRGLPMRADGWEADLSQHAEGRISARRLQPTPTAQLRLVFQP